MRLRSIKLAGFKSFVEPAHFQVPGQRVGIVGPNGCGKSNVIDAVRWVLGESRAAELRGESMQDVIFNGSGARPPARRASVELVFENDGNDESGKAGPWSQYAEIAVKRVLTRNGASQYVINQQNVRRRDVQDIFLGTGLGPRAYAIIGQGMIARLIEAKPEELRIFLEEAAGVSKYKERRRETENRLSDARENLTRVEDIRRELGANLDKLERQAARAQQYQALRAEYEETQHLLWRIQKNEAQAEVEQQQRLLNEAQAALEAHSAQLRGIEARLGTLRAEHGRANETVSGAQRALYEAQAELSRFESEIRFMTESRHRAQAQIDTLSAQCAQWQTQFETARTELADAQKAQTQAQAQSKEAQQAAQADAAALRDTEARVAQARVALTQARDVFSKLEQKRALNAAQAQNAGQLLQQLDARCTRLQREWDALEAPDEARLETLRARLAECEAQRNTAQTQLGQARNAALQADQALHAAREGVQKESALLNQFTTRIEALQQVQRNIQSGGALAPWLKRHNLAARARLWQKLRIEAGWETALEAVLRERLGAFEGLDLKTLAAFAASAPPARLAFYAPLSRDPFPSGPLAGFQPLIEKVQADDPAVRAALTEALHHVLSAEDFERAWSARSQLPAGGVFVMPAGHQISRAGVQLYAADSEQAGVLARAQEIERLERQARAQRARVDAASTRAAEAEAAQQAARRTLADLSAQYEKAVARAHALQLETQQCAQAHQSAAKRRAHLDEELLELDAHISAQRARIDEYAAHLEQADGQLAQLKKRSDEAKSAFDALDAGQAQARRRARASERAALEAQYAARAAQHRIDELGRAIQAANAQLERTQATLEQTRAELDALDPVAPKQRLDAAQVVCTEKEAELAAARAALDALTVQLRAADEARLKAEHAVAPLRAQINELQLKEQATRLRRDQFEAQLQASGANEAELAQKREATQGKPLKNAPSAGQTPAVLQRTLARLNRAIDALGAINMAALEELTAARERAQVLEAQAEDVNAAMGALENAIRTIDRETRQLLQHTFDIVNRHFGELFPRLFGGGEAKLAMTGDEILNAGVQVIAQPPGKKNARIHALSGGEKALTATALVFALFQLNPAPFCLLDEVDAPLDDANTGRFVELVRAMSERTQFLFITHNKQAMEMAQQLIGVTMREQGVSRIVAVDLSEPVHDLTVPP